MVVVVVVVVDGDVFSLYFLLSSLLPLLLSLRWLVSLESLQSTEVLW